MSKSIDEMPDQRTLDLSDISVCRNAYGAQVHSFESTLQGDPEVFGSEPVTAVLIRAPMITRVSNPSRTIFCLFPPFLFSFFFQAGANTRTLASHNGTPILVREGSLLTCTFHPEITGDTRIHKYFVDLVRANGKPYSVVKA
jgi:5'-phosphate synthase pdxT subunit